MDEQATIQEKEGKKYFLLSDKTEVLIENEVINDPAWVGIDFVPPILGLKDRQIRYKIKKLGIDSYFLYSCSYCNNGSCLLLELKMLIVF